MPKQPCAAYSSCFFTLYPDGSVQRHDPCQAMPAQFLGQSADVKAPNFRTVTGAGSLMLRVSLFSCWAGIEAAY
jgi:hypothetical protein